MTLAITSLILTGIFWLWIIRKYDRFEREPLKMIVYVLLVGGLASSFLAGLINQLSEYLLGVSSDIWNENSGTAATTMLFYMLVGVNEEILKFSTTWLMIRKSKHFNEPADALVYAMTVALGFALFENIEYAAKYGYQVFVLRQFNATPLHLGLAALWGIGIAKTRFTGKGSLLSTSFPYLLAAIVIHGIYNIIATYDLAPAASLVAVTVAAIALLWLGVRRIRKYSEEGPFSGLVTCSHCGVKSIAIAKICKRCGKPLE